MRSLSTLALTAILLACGDAGVPEPEPRPESFAPVRFVDRGLESINDRCPVRHDPLSKAVDPVYVNGRPLGFC